jgi:ABC-type polysaccharide/polyol phosphate transport system ATPase subunit
MSIEVRNVRVDLPVYNANVRSLRKVLMKATVGGAMLQSGESKVFIRALADVSIKIEDGDRVGLIGGNGAGKTTLLKVMAGVLTPSSGAVAVHGSVSAALNIGLGIDPEISGRENIFLMGYYRGLTRKQIEANIDGIVATADLGNFINLPVMTYSAGMIGRLTFAVATAFNADVLLMDEWLLAGDAAFMENAFAKTVKLVESARIVVIATHNMSAVREYCNKAVYLSGGRVLAVGTAHDIVAQYEADVHANYLASLESARPDNI